MRSVIIAIDVGSSSVRASGYQYLGVQNNCHGSQKDTQQPLVRAMEGIVHTIPMACVIPDTGYVKIHEVLSAIDACVDEVLRLLRSTVVQHESSYEIVAVGMTTFVMNLVAVDICFEPVGELATCSCACNREDVVRECQTLVNKLGPNRLNDMYQRTGTPIHPSYATPQLLAFYNNEKNKSMIKQIEKWQTIASICIHRWCGRPHGIQIPLSHSEASWTGMFDFRLGVWDDEIMDILERCYDVVRRMKDDDGELEDDVFIDDLDLFTPVVDFDSPLPYLRTGIPKYCDDGSYNTYWEKWPEFRSRSLNLFLGVGSGVASTIGSKCGSYSSPSTMNHRIAVTIEASTQVSVSLHLPIQPDNMFPPCGYVGSDIFVPPGLFCYRIDRHCVILGGTLTNGGSLVEWARSLLNLNSKESFDACLEEVSERYKKNCTALLPHLTCSSSIDDVTMIMFFNGKSITGFQGGPQSVLSGITQDTKAADIMYAFLKSETLQVGCVLKRIEKVCHSKQVEGSQGIIVMSNNGFEGSTLLRQMLADCTAMDVVADADSIEGGTSLGVAIMMAGSLRQIELGTLIRTYGYGEEPLAVIHEAKPNRTWPAVLQHWRTEMATQASLIRATAPTWRSGT